MTAPPVLTAERIDAMLSVMAEVCLESVVEAGQRQKAAEDFEAFERAGRTLQRACRNLRQTIAMKQRFDREEARKADDARKRAEGVRAEAERTKRDAVGVKRGRVLRHFERVLWDEYEDGEAHDWFDDVEGRLTDLSEDPDFLETPLDTLIQRLADDIGLGDPDDEPEPEPSPPCGERVGSGGVDAEPTVAHPHPRPLPARGRGDDAPIAEAPPPEPLAEPPPDPSPEPPPEPYIPPWERLAPGQRMPGGTGY